MNQEPVQRRRWGRRILWAVAAIAAVHVVLVFAGVAISGPFDWVLTLGSGPSHPELRTPADGRRRVVVLQHGLWRTAAALNRLERALVAHGYEVCNPGYPSLRGSIEEFAERLHGEVEALHGRPVDELSFVGHSMGGLVIQEYLRRPDARPTARCVYLAVPHRGAILADLRRHWFLFRLVMGERAAGQLATGAEFHERPIPLRERSGALIGDLGPGNASIPGPDDGTVGVTEAMLPGAADWLRVPLGHTRIAFGDESVRQVLHFLKHGAFARDGSAR